MILSCFVSLRLVLLCKIEVGAECELLPFLKKVNSYTNYWCT